MNGKQHSDSEVQKADERQNAGGSAFGAPHVAYAAYGHAMGSKKERRALAKMNMPCVCQNDKITCCCMAVKQFGEAAHRGAVIGGGLFHTQHGNKVAQAVFYACKCRYYLGVKLAAHTACNFAAGFIKCFCGSVGA